MRRAGSLIRLACAAIVVASGAGCGTSGQPPPQPSAAPASAYQRTFGPDFPPAAPAGQAQRIEGTLLARDRRSVIVSFVGGRAYDPADPCSEDYRAWAGLNGDTLSVQVTTVDHPEQARPSGNRVCTAEGYSYTFTLDLPAAFAGATVTDPGSGPLWIAPPDVVADIAALPADWRLTQVHVEPSLAELQRMYQPDPGLAGPSDRFIALFQAFDGPTSNAVDQPVATRSIHGADVAIGKNGDNGFAVGWAAGADHFWFTVVDPTVTLDAFVAMANSVAVPAP